MTDEQAKRAIPRELFCAARAADVRLVAADDTISPEMWLPRAEWTRRYEEGDPVAVEYMVHRRDRAFAAAIVLSGCGRSLLTIGAGHTEGIQKHLAGAGYRVHVDGE